MKKKLIFLALAALVLVLAFHFFPGRGAQGSDGRVRLGEASLSVDIADTPDERMLGLSGRDGLEEGVGMLFVFDEPALAGFWMKDMSFPIDIIWIGPDSRVLGIERAVSPDTYPTTFYPPSEVKYVLEARAGFSDTEKINVGDALSIGQ